MKYFRGSVAVACLAVAVCLLSQPAFAQVNPRVGTWTLDLAHSSYQQGAAPGKETRTYLATDDGGVQMTADVVLVDGVKQPVGYRAKYDGKDYPYSGAAGDTIALTGDVWMSDATIKMRGKIEQTSHSVVSKDGKTMTLVTKTASGRDVSTRVYIKQ
jgi:hypothetical protein